MNLSQIIVLSLDPTSDRTKTLITRIYEKLADAGVSVENIYPKQASDYRLLKDMETTAKEAVFNLLHETKFVHGDFSRTEPELAMQALSHLGAWNEIERESVMTTLIVDDTMTVNEDADFSILKRIPATTYWDIIALDNDYGLSSVEGSTPMFVKGMERPCGAYIIRGPSIKKLRSFLSPLVAPAVTQLYLLSKSPHVGAESKYTGAVYREYSGTRSPFTVHHWNKLFVPFPTQPEPDLFTPPLAES